MTEPLRWQLNLGEGQSFKRLVVCTVIVGVFAFGFFVMKNLILAILGVVMITLSVGEFMFVTHYEVNEKGVRSRWGVSLREMMWENVRSVYLDDHGVKFSPLTKGSRMDGFRGVYLRFANNRDQVLATIRDQWDGFESVLGARDSG